MFRVSGFWSAVGAVVVAVMIADFVAHPSGTQQLATAGTNAEKSALNAELGKSS